jgi:hypothetical protein
MRSSTIAAAALLASVAGASTLKPPVLPLIVRNPYLSTWLQNAREEPWSKWPMFWTGAELGLGVLASLTDSKEVFPLLGRPHDSLEKDSKEYVNSPYYRLAYTIESDRGWRIHEIKRGVTAGCLALMTSSLLYEQPK